jgi:hypothetical protein
MVQAKDGKPLMSPIQRGDVIAKVALTAAEIAQGIDAQKSPLRMGQTHRQRPRQCQGKWFDLMMENQEDPSL